MGAITINSMIIGLSGTLAAGKDSIADILVKKGFSYYSCSDMLREECAKRGIESNRDNLIMVGKELRARQGYSVLAKRILEKIRSKKQKNAVVVSIRHPDEVNEFRRHRSFEMIFVDAPIEMRYERIKKRNKRPQDKAMDNVSFDKFRQQEKEEHATEGASQQLGVVKRMADFILINDGSLEKFHNNIKSLFRRIGIN